MKYIKNNFLTLCAIGSFTIANAQDLDQLMNEAQKDNTEYAYATFKGTRVINGHSIEAPSKGVLQVMFSHRFGTLNDPFYNFFGFDQGASVRFGFDYGISNRLAVGIGRSSTQKAYDGYLKYKLLRQSTGAINMPVSVSILEAVALSTQDWPYAGVYHEFAYNLYYTSQLLIARKFSQSLSLQFMPTIVHRNFTASTDQKNTLLVLGFAGRLKLSKRFSLTGEYYWNLPNQLGAGNYNPVSLGVDIETGGHVFQIHLTNTLGMIEPQFIGATSSNVTDGLNGIRLGFNFSRVFTIVKYSDVKNNW